MVQSLVPILSTNTEPKGTTNHFGQKHLPNELGLILCDAKKTESGRITKKYNQLLYECMKENVVLV